MQQLILVFAVCLALLCLSACGGRGGQPQAFGAVTIELTVPPNEFGSTSATIVPGGTVSITAVVYDPQNQGVTWSTLPLTFGSLTNQTPTAVTFVAPAQFSTSTTVTITASSVTNPNVTASVKIAAAPITVSLVTPLSYPPFYIPLSDQTIPPGAAYTLQALVAYDVNSAGVTWSLSPPSAGTLSINGSAVTYAAPSTASTATVTATSVSDPSIASSVRFNTLLSGAGSNVAAINVNGGPVPGHVYTNGAFIDGVTICNPGSKGTNYSGIPICETVDGILVDTGSYGLRILQSQIPLLSLPTVTTPRSANLTGTLENCYAFPDGGFLWGPVAQADVYIGGEMVSSYASSNSAAIQVISESNVTNPQLGTGIPDGCSNGGTALNTPQLLGANGILGIGPEPTDCTLGGANYCDGTVQATPPNIYYACPSTGCLLTDTPVLASATQQQQVQNLVPLFGAGETIINLPSVTGSESAVSGTLTFGGYIPGATTYTLNTNNTFTTIFNGQTLTSSFLDTGSNALYFPAELPGCPLNTGFFCPASLTSLSAENQGTQQGQQGSINLSVGNADTLLSTYPGFAAFETLSGPDGVGTCSNGTGACTFDWGLPFFYGRPVLTKIETCLPPPDACPASNAAAWSY